MILGGGFPAFSFWICPKNYYTYKKDMNRTTVKDVLPSLKSFAKKLCLVAGVLFILLIVLVLLAPPALAASLFCLTIVLASTYKWNKRRLLEKQKMRGETKNRQITSYVLNLSVLIVLCILSLTSIFQTIIIAMSM
ncbi:hypothetical protein AKH06_12780 [Vibrio parahaemolyticus]|nr:hypothetical protein AKH06_12780 [Vibrio parahaemolyticus]